MLDVLFSTSNKASSQTLLRTDKFIPAPPGWEESQWLVWLTAGAAAERLGQELGYP